MAGYVYFTEEQKQRANSVDLVQFLQNQGEKFLPSGREKRLDSDHSITIRGSQWYDHAAEEGGYAIDLIKRLYGLPFPTAVSMLLNGEQGAESRKQEMEPRKPFKLPEANSDMRRVYAYLMKQRFIDRNVIYEFAKEKLIYEDKLYHNIVFVGLDEHGVARHAHKKSTFTLGTGYRGNVEGSNPEYSFHYISKNSEAHNLYVFEAPIDMLSYISLNQKNWRNHHYVALNGVSEKALINLMNLYPQINHVVLGLDYDVAGIEACEKIFDLLAEKGVNTIERLKPINKDWNEDLKAKNGIAPIPAEVHPQLVMKEQICNEVKELINMFTQMDITLDSIKENYDRCKHQISRSEFEVAKEYFKDLTAFTFILAKEEYHKSGMPQEKEEIENRINCNFRAYQNRGKLEHKMSDISKCLRSLFLLQEKVKSKEVNKAELYEQLAGDFLKAAVLTELKCLAQIQTTELNKVNSILLS